VDLEKKLKGGALDINVSIPDGPRRAAPDGPLGFGIGLLEGEGRGALPDLP
jgi:hypothetical protein